jgi:hypothetical protein
MSSLIYLAIQAPSTLADELMQHGHQVFEALSISEVLHLLETEDIDVVLIAYDVEKDLGEVEARTATLRLNAGATVKDVLWELSLLFPAKEAIQ